MKKQKLLCIILWLAVLALLAWAMSPGSVLAAGSCVQQSLIHGQAYGPGTSIVYLCTGDASDGSVPDTEITFSKLLGSFYYEIETIPGTGAAEPTVYSVTLKNSRGTTIAAVTGRSATAAETETIDTGPHVIDTAVTMSVSDLGNSDTATIILKFIK